MHTKSIWLQEQIAHDANENKHVKFLKPETKLYTSDSV